MDGNVLDVFNSNTFSMSSMTDSIMRLPYVPDMLDQLGIFADQGINTTTLMIEEKNGLLALIPTAARGAPAPAAKSPKRKMRSFVIPHIPLEDEILAESIQGVRMFGTTDVLETINNTVNDRLMQLRQSHEATLEHLRMGALAGIIYDADGTSVIYNLFTEFGITQTQVDFKLGTSTTRIRSKCMTVIRAVEEALGAMPFSGVIALCGRDWFDRFVDHDNVRAAYLNWQSNETLRVDVRKGFVYGGIEFRQYRGKVNGIEYIDPAQVQFFPTGVPNLFRNYYAPADFIETVNTIGVPIYARQHPLPFNRGIQLHTQSNPLPMCTRPGVLVQGISSN